MRPVLCWILLLMAALLAGCTSFYGSSILGHDAVDIPFQETPREKLSLGFTARVAALKSQYTRDSTRFWQAGPVLVWSGPRDDKTVVGSLAFTAYQAETSLHQPSNQTLQGRGWTLETKDGVILPLLTEVSVSGEWHNGFSCPDLVLLTTPLLGSAATVRLRVFQLSLAYTRGVMSVLNQGDSLHVTVQL